ncbi:ABC transporter ATP-binding protein [Allostreptomyces psammosilenae]|uniref:Iron complex transport system ATP-binding protein n=1 Tax=Allostreptomyces psammosilenae TaxID=1892865 RepID=A0A852ZPP9_9ACTN|nr:ABC transporter ATP-binding protein [Allostreptomyces psammosilenae]NYI04363.1 iron complex transport system ATP-binding protein [Allostreptomyces psammosilenae]
MGDVRLVVESLDVGHGDRPVLTGVNLTLRAGTMTALVGPNGCGKSTLLRTMAGLLPAMGGGVLVDGAPLGSLSRRALSRSLAFLPQTPLVPAGVTVRELVRHGRYAHRGAFARHTAEDAQAVEWALEVSDAARLADRRLDELSGGERQRAWLATVLAQRSGIVLLDEPTTYLDLRHQFEVLEVVHRLVHEHGIACGVVLHDLMQASAYADEIVVVSGGAVAASGTPEDVLTPDVIDQAFGLKVSVLRDPETGYLACFPRLPDASAAAAAAASS